MCVVTKSLGQYLKYWTEKNRIKQKIKIQYTDQKFKFFNNLNSAIPISLYLSFKLILPERLSTGE